MVLVVLRYWNLKVFLILELCLLKPLQQHRCKVHNLDLIGLNCSNNNYINCDCSKLMEGATNAKKNTFSFLFKKVQICYLLRICQLLIVIRFWNIILDSCVKLISCSYHSVNVTNMWWPNVITLNGGLCIKLAFLNDYQLASWCTNLWQLTNMKTM